jgi:N-glycosylase/DNA lyase
MRVRMYQLTIENFDIRKICYSGQCFRMKEREENTFEIIAYGHYIEICQKENVVTMSCTEEEFHSIWKTYLGLDDDYNTITGLVNEEDRYMKKAMSFGWGIRILKQELWETIVSFLISQQNNIPRIKKSIQMLCERYGDKKLNLRGEVYYTFPKPEALHHLTDSVLKECNLGYRSKYILRTAKAIVDGSFDLEALPKLSYEEARKELMKLYGVGIKVSECICLYALHHLNAFPIDTHIQKVLENNYPDGFPFEQYRGYSGALQQYAFYYDLNAAKFS